MIRKSRKITPQMIFNDASPLSLTPNPYKQRKPVSTSSLNLHFVGRKKHPLHTLPLRRRTCLIKPTPALCP
jgi:hypothetical protein